MVNVNESDMSFMNVLLHGKGHGGLRKAALASIAAVFAAVAITVMRAGDTDLSMSLLIGLVIAGCYALWLGFLAYSVYDLRALLTMGARGKAAVVIGLAAPLVLLLWLWGSSARMVAIFYGMGEPFAFPVLVNAVMLVTGFFSGSPYDGDEELARRIQDLSPADLTGLPLEEVPFSPEDLFTLMGGFDLGYVACSTRNLNGKAIMRKQAYKDEWRRDLVKRYHAAGWVDAEGNPNEELGRWVRLISSPGVVIMNDKFGRGTAEVIFNDDAARWPHITWVILGCMMFVGACSGSTTGGFKCVRAVMIMKVLRNEFHKLLHPNAVLPVKINGVPVPHSQLNTLLAFFAIFTIMVILTATLMIAAGIDNTNAVTISLSCISNVGPTLGTQIGPEMSWSALPAHVKWICSFLMLVGRLEIMSVLVLFTPGFWKDN